MATSNSSTFVNPKSQSFPFPSEIIIHILQNSNAQILKKLHKSCKYFFVKKPLIIIDKLFVSCLEQKLEFSISSFKNISNYYFLTIPQDHTFWEKLNNVWVTEELLCDINDYEKFASIVSKIIRCTAKVIDWILMINFPMKEFKKFTEAGTVEKFGVNVPNHLDANAPPVEELLALIPNAFETDINTCHATSATLKNLILLERNRKFKRIQLLCFDKNDLDPTEMAEFLMKHVELDAEIDFTFLGDHRLEETNPFKAVVNEKLKAANSSMVVPIREIPSFTHQQQQIL